MMADQASILEQLEAVSRAFKTQLPERGREIERQWSAVRKQPDDLDLLEGLYRLTHNLAGAGGTFGFSQITDVAREVTEPLRITLKERKVGLSDAEQASLDARVKLLTELCIHPTLDTEANIPPAKPLFPELPATLHSLTKLVYLLSECTEDVSGLVENLQNLGARVGLFESVKSLGNAILETPPAAVLVNSPADEELLTFDLPETVIRPPMIMLSESDDFDSRLSAVRAGMEGFFVKPIDASAVLNLVDSLRPREEASPFRVLIVDDDQSQAEYASIVLEQAGITTRVIHDPTEVLEQLAEFNPELLLFDVYMPQCSGIELAKIVRQMDNYVGVPIIFLSVERERIRQLEALQTGADDFLTKPIRPKELVSSVMIRAWRARTLRWLMVRDSLTGLFNHAVIMERLNNSFALAQRQNSHLSVAMIDLDHFKRINDNYGHSTGDRVLIGFSRLLRERLRESDVVGRYGGEEFLVVLPDTTLEHAELVIEAVRTAFAKTSFTANGALFSVTLSAGIAGFPRSGSASGLLDAADIALYKAKEQGRNRTITAAPQP
ncbi:MAG: diguanylate cyclase [Sedimenticola selenatireducens]|uniref:diguanylate cyclase n=2 Tax=Sedimenticola selenatireducens TaxID=191960 RepID=A0A558DZK8_9GAMM|nr:diguanylate cyclase [Sedimenticola selenatireducens]TVT66329.1 MAG: diguanylate cyclase [Sedimenticola selenatireducens]